MHQRTRLVGTAGALTAAGLLAITLVGRFEGVRTVAYRDAVGVPTVCFGETRGVKMGDRHTLDECKVMLKDGLVDFEQGMRRCLKDPDSLPDKTYVAFLSFSYNVGVRAACGSSIFRAANAGDLRAACNRLPLWSKAGGRTLSGLVKRRDDERSLCLAGLSETKPTSRAIPAPEPPPPPSVKRSEKMEPEQEEPRSRFQQLLDYLRG